MALLLSHMTAADFWRRIYRTGKAPGPAQRTAPRESPACTADEIWCLAPSWITRDFIEAEQGIVHATVCDEGSRRHSKSHWCHVWQGEFPAGSFYRLNEEAYVASPSFTFLQLAQSLNLAQLVAYGNEICGLYSLDGSSSGGLRQRSVPLVTVDELAGFVASAGSARGVALARKALDMVVERSASPQETTVEMLQCLPYRYGGYGLPAPVMNHAIALSGEAASLARRSALIADACWPEHRIDLEFLGEGPHSGASALHSDRARTIALSAMNYSVIEITSQQVRDLGAFELVTLQIAKMLGKRVAVQYRGPLPKRVELRHELFSWNRASGRPPKLTR